MKLDKLISGYRLYCQAEGKSQHTIRWYMGKLAVFSKYLRDFHPGIDVSDITSLEIRGFITYMQDSVKADELNPMKPTKSQPLSKQTIQGYVRVIKAFFSWASREELIPDNPARRVKVPKAPRTVIATFSDSQIRKFLAVIDQTRPTGFRNYCMVLTLLDTGIRLSELVGMQLPELHLDDGYFKVMGKGAKERIVPIGANLQKSLWKYVMRFRPQPAHPNLQDVFLAHDGRALAGRTVYRFIQDYGEKAGISGLRCSPHTFRHTFAKSFLLNGGDVFSLQKILGHSSLAVVRMYVELASEDVQVQHRRYSPVDVMKLRA